MKQNREPRKRPTQLSSTDFWQRNKSNSMRETQSLQQMVLETSGHPHAKRVYMDRILVTFINSNSQWIVNLNLNSKLNKTSGR